MTEPRISAKALVLPQTVIVGDVELDDFANVWYGCVLRGDIAPIRVGKYTNIQDLSVLHVDRDRPCVVGDFVTVGHRALLHGCVIGDRALVGMGAIVLSGAKVGEGAIVGAGALVKEGMEIPPGMLAVGVPARVIRPVKRGDHSPGKHARGYVREARAHLRGEYGRS